MTWSWMSCKFKLIVHHVARVSQEASLAKKALATQLGVPSVGRLSQSDAFFKLTEQLRVLIAFWGTAMQTLVIAAFDAVPVSYCINDRQNL